MKELFLRYIVKWKLYTNFCWESELHWSVEECVAPAWHLEIACCKMYTGKNVGFEYEVFTLSTLLSWLSSVGLSDFRIFTILSGQEWVNQLYPLPQNGIGRKYVCLIYITHSLDSSFVLYMIFIKLNIE